MIQVSEHRTVQINSNKGVDLVGTKQFVGLEYVYGYDLPVATLKVRVSWDRLHDFVPQVKDEEIVYELLIGDGGVVREFFRGKLVKYGVVAVADEVLVSVALIGVWKAMDRKIRAWKGTSVQVVEAVAGELGVKCKNSVKSKFSDKMVWIQSESSKRFLNHVWRHSYSEDSFLLVGYDGDGVVVSDVKSLRQKRSEPWKLTTKDFEQGYIRVSVVGMDRSVWQFSASEVENVCLDTGGRVVEKIEVPVVYGDEVYRLYDKRVSRFWGDNVYEKYWVALERNRAYFSNKFRVEVTINHEYYEFELFDLCYLSHSEIEVSGFYFIEKIERYVTLDNQFVTKLWLCREGM